MTASEDLFRLLLPALQVAKASRPHLQTRHAGEKKKKMQRGPKLTPDHPTKNFPIKFIKTSLFTCLIASYCTVTVNHTVQSFRHGTNTFSFMNS